MEEEDKRRNCTRTLFFPKDKNVELGGQADNNTKMLCTDTKPDTTKKRRCARLSAKKSVVMASKENIYVRSADVVVVVVVDDDDDVIMLE